MSPIFLRTVYQVLATSAASDRVLELEDDLRLARLGVAADLVGTRHFLQRALDLVGHLLGHLLRGGARPVGTHHHGAEGEGRVLVLAQLEVGRKAQHHQHHQQVARQRRMLDRPAREIEVGLAAVVLSVLLMPASLASRRLRWCRPAGADCRLRRTGQGRARSLADRSSPSGRARARARRRSPPAALPAGPQATTASLPSAVAICTGCDCTVMVLGVQHPDGRRLAVLAQRAGRQLDSCNTRRRS